MSKPITPTDDSDIIGSILSRLDGLESDTASGLMQPGMVVWSPGFTTPYSWAIADGHEINRGDYPRCFDFLTIQTTGTVTNGSASVPVPGNVAALVNPAGAWAIEGTGIPSGTTISGVSGSSLTLSANAVSSASNVAIRILPWGGGDGALTFNVPNLQDQALVGINISAPEFQYLAQKQGEKTHTLTGDESGTSQHAHGPGSLQVGAGQAGHNHNTGGSGAQSRFITGNGSPVDARQFDTGSKTTLAGMAQNSFVTTTGNSSLPSLNVTAGSTANTTPVNAANAHNNLQPSIAGYYLVKLDPV